MTIGATPRIAPAAALLVAAMAGGCAVEATGFATDFRTVRSGTIRAGTAEPLLGLDGRCEAVAGVDPSTLRAPGGAVAIGMSECQLVDALGPPADVRIERQADGRRVASLDYDERTGSGGVTYVLVDNRLLRIER